MRLVSLAILLVWQLARATAPPIVYAWNRPERLAALPEGSEVAVYAATVSLRDGETVWQPRLHPIALPDHARVTAVIHFEPGWRPLDDRLRAYLVDKISGLHAQAIQIDYEAPLSQREFLRELMGDLRRALPQGKLSMTALASWCLFDDWLRELPVDEVVPMVYRMGHDREPVRRWLDEGHDFRVPLCRKAVAVSLADPPPRLPAGRRTYYFAPRSWSEAELREISR